MNNLFSEIEQIMADYQALHTRMLKIMEEMKLQSGRRERKVGGWSYYYDKCASCGTTSKEGRNRHWGNGLCMGCYNKISIKAYRKRKKLSKLNQPHIEAPAMPVEAPKVEKPPVAPNKKLGQYIPINCYQCGQPFQQGDDIVEVENDENEREDCHRKCYLKLFD